MLIEFSLLKNWMELPVFGNDHAYLLSGQLESNLRRIVCSISNEMEKMRLVHISMPLFNLLKYDPLFAQSSSYVPDSTTFPSLMTNNSSQFRMVLRRWAITIDVLPSMALSSAYCTISCEFSSSAEVASSRINILGYFISALAIAIRYFWPPESFPPRNPHSF